MSNSSLNKIMFPSLCTYENEIDFVDKLISIYGIMTLSSKDSLRNFEKDVLNYYVRFGYSIETKNMIKEDLNKSAATITQATFYLKKKGLVVDSKTNLSTKFLCDDLQKIREGFLKGDKKILSIGFKRK